MLRSPLVRAQLKHLCTKNCILKEHAVAPSSTCPNWTFSTTNADVATWEGIFLPPIQKRINRILSPVQLTTSEVCIICSQSQRYRNRLLLTNENRFWVDYTPVLTNSLHTEIQHGVAYFRKTSSWTLSTCE